MEPLACSNQPLTCSDLTDKFDKWENNPIQIHHIDPEEDWELAEKVEPIRIQTGIRFGNNKNVSIIATDKGGNVVGGVADEFKRGEDYGHPGGYIYDFDTVVHPKHQKSSSLVGPQLINEAVEKAKQSGSIMDQPVHMIRTYCVNPRLAQMMVNHFDFEPENDYAYRAMEPVHLVRYL